jgi:hypothetical protein
MPLETVPPGQVSDGHGLVLFVPTIADPSAPTVAELTAGTVKKITYSITGDGYAHATTVATVVANRLPLAQALQYDGTVTDDLEITYAYTNTAGDVVRLALPQGTTGFIVERWAYANELAIAAAQLVDVIPIKASLQRKNPPATNTELTRTQKLNVTGTVYRDVLVAA